MISIGNSMRVVDSIMRSRSLREMWTNSAGRWAVAFSVLMMSIHLVAPAEATDAKIRRGYVDGRFGQIHYYTAMPSNGTARQSPIVFFHQNPKSGMEYEFLLSDLGRDRIAIAIDTPGYGGSDRPAAPPTMQGLVGAMADALDSMGYGKSGKGGVDVFGFHTGAFIAAELAVSRPDLVNRVVLSGIAFKSLDERRKLLANNPTEYHFPEDASKLLNRWWRIVTTREPGVTLERAQRIFHEDTRSLGYWWYAYNAVWNYAVDTQLPKITQPVLIIEPHDMLLQETRRAHQLLLPKATYVELPEIKQESRVFETGSPLFARELRKWLDRP